MVVKNKKKVSKGRRKPVEPEVESEIRELPPDMPAQALEGQSMIQKKIAFANSGHVETVLAILKESNPQPKLVGETEFETVKNAITLDAQAEMMINFIQAIDHIKKGGLVQTEI